MVSVLWLPPVALPAHAIELADLEKKLTLMYKHWLGDTNIQLVKISFKGRDATNQPQTMHKEIVRIWSPMP